MLGEGKKTTVYSTTDYWVAQDSHHVYEKGTGHIIDIIEEDESIKIEGNKITVTKRTVAYSWGCALTVLFGMCTVGLIIGYVGNSDWWDKVAHG